MENFCYYVCSRGLLKSCHFHSKNPKSSCNNDTRYLLNMLTRIFDGMSIYVCSDLLQFFVNNILPKINKRFVLVSGDSDMCVPREALNAQQFNQLINSPFLIKWFLQNTQIQDHSKMIQMPIGLDYHTISNNPNHEWKLPSEGYLPRFQERILMNIKEESKPFYERIPKIYVNFSKNNDRFQDRKACLETIPDFLCIKNEGFTQRTMNWNNITNYAFVLSPFGVGMDCHRTWEALCLGSIPILKAPNFRKMFEGLPVLIVNEWSEVSEDLLNNTLISFKEKEEQNLFNYDKLKLSFWVDQIRNKT